MLNKIKQIINTTNTQCFCHPHFKWATVLNTYIRKSHNLSLSAAAMYSLLWEAKEMAVTAASPPRIAALGPFAPDDLDNIYVIF